MVTSYVEAIFPGPEREGNASTLSTDDLKTAVFFRKKSLHQGTCTPLSMQHCYSLFLCFEYCTLNTLNTILLKINFSFNVK